MINTLTLLLLYQLAGELFVRLLSLPVSGPVIGMILFFLTLLAKGHVNQEIRADVGALLQHMSLLFIPAGAGVMLHLQRIGSEWLPISISLVISTFAGMAVTAWVIKAMLPKGSDQAPRKQG